MREKRVAAKNDDAKEINVELSGSIRKRLRLYAAAKDTTIKKVVSDALDRYLPPDPDDPTKKKQKRGT